MNAATQDALQQALALTIAMSDAAADGNWTLVTDLDEQRQAHLKQMHGVLLGPQDRDALAALQAQNRALLERAQQVRDAVEEQLSQHQYNHRALRAYVTSAG
jgi:hypothetical protein